MRLQVALPNGGATRVYGVNDDLSTRFRSSLACRCNADNTPQRTDVATKTQNTNAPKMYKTMTMRRPYKTHA